ncbi:MAG: peptidylprolyl isomerase [Coriobacteriia bacterium]
MADKGQLACVRYKGFLDDGTVFDSTDGIEPLEFVIGSGAVIPGFEKAVLGMAKGESTKVTIPCAEAYGEYCEDAVQTAPAATIPNAGELPVGETIYFNAPDGQCVPAKVLKIEQGLVYFDFNHRLAGKDLTFEITLVDLR